MDEQERQVRLKSETDNLYRAVGRFVVKFEHLCHAMSWAVLFAFEVDGLRTQKLGQAAIADLTADPLRSIFMAVYAQLVDGKEERRILKALNKRIQDLIKQRNKCFFRIIIKYRIGYTLSRGNLELKIKTVLCTISK